MRAYLFCVGSKFFTSNGNPTPLNIQFSFHTYKDGLVNETGFIRLFNPPPEMFIEAKSYIGQNFTLNAGWIDTPLTSKLGYLPLLDDLLVYGKLTGVLGSYYGKEPYIDFYFSPEDAPKEEKKKGQLGSHTIQIPPNTLVVVPAGKILRELLNMVVVSKAFANAVFNRSGTTLIFTFIRVAELLNWLRETFGIYSVQNPKTNTMSLLTEKDRIPEGAGLLRKVEFLTQPEVMNQSGELSAVVRLRSDLKVGDLVVIEGGMIPGFSNIGTFTKTINKKLTQEYTKLFQTGSYTITSIEHTGEFYNPDPTAWSSQLTLMPFPKPTSFL